MNFPDKLDQEDMKLIKKEWRLAGYSVRGYVDDPDYITVGDLNDDEKRWTMWVDYKLIGGCWKKTDRGHELP